MPFYRGIYKGRELEIQAPTKYAAQEKLAEMFKAKKSYQVNVQLLALDDGVPIVHLPLM